MAVSTERSCLAENSLEGGGGGVNVARWRFFERREDEPKVSARCRVDPPVNEESAVPAVPGRRTVALPGRFIDTREPAVPGRPIQSDVSGLLML